MKWLRDVFYQKALKAYQLKLTKLVNKGRYFAQEALIEMSDEKARLRKKDIGAILESTIATMAENNQYYYHSVVDDKYSKLTPEGREAVIALVEMLMPKIRQANKDEIDEKLKSHVWDTLKK